MCPQGELGPNLLHQNCVLQLKRLRGIEKSDSLGKEHPALSDFFCSEGRQT